MPGILNVSGAPSMSGSGSKDPMQLLMKGSRPSILSRKIGFVPGKSSVTTTSGDGKKKVFTTSYAGGTSRSSNHPTQQDLQLSWKKSQSIGPGLVNLGNTCFLNSVLQCLTYTPPLAQALQSKPHDCQSPSACTMHAMESHVRKSLSSSSSSSSAFCPKTIISKLKAIAKHFRMGRQEDSHEFMLHLLDAMEKTCHGKKPAQKDSGIVNGVFGGAIQSQVKCMSCKHESNAIDPVMDLCLEIKNCDSLEKALALYTKAELLSGRNKYKCENCKKLVDAQKRLTLDANPGVLAIQLKRFDFLGSFGSKINRYIKFPETLDVNPYMSSSKKVSVEKYRLYGVLVHSGGSCHSGHYYCFVKGANGIWYCMNDSDVKQVSFKTVMQQSAYMLFYVRDAAVSVSSNPVISPVPVKAAIPPKRKEHIQRDFMITPPLSPVLLNQPVAAMPVTLKKDVRPSQLAQKEEKAMTPKTPKESPKKAEKKVQISAASLLDEFMDLGSAPSPKKVSKPIVEKSLPVSPKPEPVAIPMPDARPVLTPNTLAKKQKPSKKCQKMCNATDAWIVETFAALDKTPSKKLSDEDKTVKAVSQKTWKIEETPVKQTGDDNVTPKRERSDSHTHSVETHVASSGGDRSTSLFLNNGLSIPTWEGGAIKSVTTNVDPRDRKRLSRDDMEYEAGKLSKIHKKRKMGVDPMQSRRGGQQKRNPFQIHAQKHQRRKEARSSTVEGIRY